jgi:glutamine synthetase
VADLPAGEALLNLGTNRLATIAQDNTDRNRTSPFAFTGNKFEFRAVGASASISFPTAVVNTVVADGICQIAAWIREDGGPEAPMAAIRRALVESTPVRFDGNGYSAEWVEEAQRRGLPHARNTPAALAALATQEVELLFGRHDVLSAEELHSRYEVRVEQYNKKVDIERELLCELVDTLIWPAAVAEGFDVEPMGEEGAQLRRRRRERAAFEELSSAREAVDALEGLSPSGDEMARAGWLAADLVPALLRLRLACDAVEALIPDASWPLAKYREMLFLV